jgi:multiple sugar transport system substrate-binding protein
MDTATIRSPRLSRRSLIGRAALSGAAGVATGLAGGRSLAAAGGVGRRSARPVAQGGLSGQITVSFTDSSGLRTQVATAAAAEIQAANPGATIAVEAQTIPGGEFEQALFLGMQAGDIPDVFHVGGGYIGLLAAAGALRPLDAHLAEWPDWDHYSEPVRGGVRFDGQIWAIPYALDTHFLYYRKDIFQQAGLPADWSPAGVDAILDAALAIKQNVPDVFPYALYTGVNGGNASVVRAFLPLVLAYGGSMTDEQGRWIIDSPAIRKTFAYYHRAYQVDQVIPQDALAIPNQSGAFRTMLGTGQLAMFFDGAWIYGPLHDADPAGVEANLGYLLHPTEGGGPSFTVGGTGQVWFISAACQAPDLAWEFVKTINSAESVAQICVADPHPAARSDAAALPEYQADSFLMEATATLENAKFVTPSPAYDTLIPIIQRATDLVASGQAAPEEAAARYRDELTRLLGEDNVVTQS